MNCPEKFCRFCLSQIEDNNFENLGEPPAYDVFCPLNLKINLDIIEKPVICIRCMENLRKLFTFKVTCVATESCLIPFVNSQLNKKIDMQQIYLKVNGNKCLMDKKICRFCMCETPINSSLELNALLEVALGKKCLPEYLPEIDMNLAKNTIVCKTCYNFLEDYQTFTRTCINMEENIQKYVEIEGTNAEGKIDLKSVKQFMDKLVIKKEIDDIGSIKDEIHQPDEIMEDPYCNVDIKLESYMQIEDSELEIKTENVEQKPIVKSPGSAFDIASAESREDCKEHFIIDEDSSYIIESDKCDKYKSRCKGYSQPQMSHHNNTSAIMARRFKHRKLTFEREYHPSEVTMYKCGTENCSYETRCKRNLVQHNLNHKDPSEVIMHKCGFEGCLYETKRKSHLIRHSLKHKDASEVIMYKCGFKGCLYETKCKSYLMDHTLTHKDPSKVTMYKCGTENCSFETRYKKNLVEHNLSHKDTSEVIMYKCGFEGCLYETKRKRNLLAHKLKHKDLSEVTVYKCGIENCSYETKLKFPLIRHTLIHKDASEVTMYKCEIEGCSFETKHKGSLTGHKLVHKDVSEVMMYKCGVRGCSYDTKHKGYLKKHKLIHKDSSEVTMYNPKTDVSSYETKNKMRLAWHKLIREDQAQLIAPNHGNQEFS